MRYCFNIYLPILFIIIISFIVSPIFAQNSSFEESTFNGEGSLNIHWHESNPFIYFNKQGNLAGIEFEIITGFQDYLFSRYSTEIELNWILEPSFYDVLDKVKTSSESNHFGASALSITDERKKEIDFTNPYFSDISVLISYGNNLTITKPEDFKLMADSMTAVTIRGTTYEKMLLDIQDEIGIELKINYVPSYVNVVENILTKEGQFGFIDLPIYLLFLEDGAKIKRHDFFTNSGSGFGLILPKTSDWKAPFDEYLSDPITQTNIRKILEKYLGNDIYLFMNELNKGPEIQESILAKEKELVQKSYNDATSILKREKKIRFFLSITITFIVLLLLLLLFLFFYVSKKNKRLQLSEIKLIHERDMRSMNNKRLMNRNVQLNTISEEKNTLFHMVVHDLRTPINNIQGLIELFQNEEIKLKEDEQKPLLKKMHESCIRMNKLIDQIFSSEKGGIQKKNSLNEELDLVELFQNMLDYFTTNARKKHIELVIDSKPNSCIVHSDYLQLTQIFENLISNAVKFSPEYSKITCSVKCTPTDAIVEIMDNGPGFNADDKLSLFKIFQPLTAKPTGGEKSTGLGLAIVKRCCDAIGAKLTLDDDYNKGALFIVTIPNDI